MPITQTESTSQPIWRNNKPSIDQVPSDPNQNSVVAKPTITQPINQTVAKLPVRTQVTNLKSNLDSPKFGQKTIGSKPIVNTQENKKQLNSDISAVDQKELKEILVEIGRLLLMTQIYKETHPIVRDKLTKLSTMMIKVANSQGRLVLSNRDDIVFLNGYQEKVTSGPLEKLKDTLRFLKVASFEFGKGITEPEIGLFFKLVASKRREKEAIDIKVQLKEQGLVHIKPIFLQYVEVDEIPKEVPKPQNVIAGTKHGYKNAHGTEEQIVTDFLKGKLTEMPKKVNTFLLNHPKLAAMVMVKLLDEYKNQNLDNFAAFQSYIQSMSHYMARLSRQIEDPDKVEKTLEKLEKHLVIRLKSLKKDSRYINETKHEIKEAIFLIREEQLLSQYGKAKIVLEEKELAIVEAIEKRKVSSIPGFKEKLGHLGKYKSKLTNYFTES